nr:MAG TPA: hypothetical protein [Caudoviricetes sp.]
MPCSAIKKAFSCYHLGLLIWSSRLFDKVISVVSSYQKAFLSRNSLENFRSERLFDS